MDLVGNRFKEQLEGYSVHLFSALVGKYQSGFECVKCGLVSLGKNYRTEKCSHYFCEECVNRNACVQCHICKVEINVGELMVDPLYHIFAACFKKKESQRLSSEKNSPEKPLQIFPKKHIKKHPNFMLQEECKKIFKGIGGNIETVKALLKVKANPNVLRKDGSTLMHEAVAYENIEVLDCLLSAGGLVNAYSTKKCSTCLHNALDAAAPNYEVIKTLLNYGADIHARDIKGLTPLKKSLNYPYIANALISDIKLQITPKKTRPIGPYLLYGDNLTWSHQKKLSLFCQNFKIKSYDSHQKFSKEITHVVVEEDPCQTSYGVLMGIVTGCYIVSFNWIKKSLKKNIIVDASNYEITGTVEFPRSNAPRKSRLNSENLQPQLFTGGRFRIQNRVVNNKISKSEEEILMHLITAGGGSIFNPTKSYNENNGETVLYHAYGGPLQNCSVVILHKHMPFATVCDTVSHLPIDWLYKSIQTFKLAA